LRQKHLAGTKQISYDTHSLQEKNKTKQNKNKTNTHTHTHTHTHTQHTIINHYLGNCHSLSLIFILTTVDILVHIVIVVIISIIFIKLSSEAMTTYYFHSCTAVRACVRPCVRHAPVSQKHLKIFE
jgi:hypothetical protein